MIVSSQDINLLLCYLVLLDLKFLIPRHDDGVHDNGVHDGSAVKHYGCVRFISVLFFCKSLKAYAMRNVLMLKKRKVFQLLIKTVLPFKTSFTAIRISI